jgi:tetratricopeptide (TPR) repeat protein
VADSSRLEDLRRRVQQDPSSIAFAQLAEEYRRAAMFHEAVDVCRAGLASHPGYLSARVTLGRALIELNQFQHAQQELEQVLRAAPENLAAIRGLADVLQRQGAVPAALAQYRAALTIVRHDPDLEQTIEELERQIAMPKASEATGALPLAGEDDSQETAGTTMRAIAIAEMPAVEFDGAVNEERTHALATVAALEQLLTAVHVARAQPSA